MIREHFRSTHRSSHCPSRELPSFLPQNPLFSIITAQTTIMDNLLRELGLTPSSRTRIAVAQPPEELDELTVLAAEARALIRPY